MSWHFSRALVAEFLEGDSSAGGLFAPLSMTPTPQAFCSPDRMTEFSRLSRFGMTFAPLMEDLGAALLTWFLEGFHVRTSAPPGREPESLVNAPDFGGNSPGLLAKFDPATRSWKTPQFSLLGGSELFSETWPRWGTMRAGACWALPTPGRPISETVSGSWPTPHGFSKDGKSNGPSGNELGRAVNRARVPTPAASDWKGSSKPGQRRGQLTDPAMGVIPAGGSLNPRWVEWLMGWPLGWTDLGALETDKFRQWLRSHGKL